MKSNNNNNNNNKETNIDLKSNIEDCNKENDNIVENTSRLSKKRKIKSSYEDKLDQLLLGDPESEGHIKILF